MVMAPTSKKQTSDTKNTAHRSLKNRLAVATMAASLGVSLGVPVGEALAMDDTLKTPPGYTHRDSRDEAFEQLELSTQADQDDLTKESMQIKLESRQGKFRATDSTQIKLNSVESRQGKFKALDSKQIKLDRQIDADLDSVQTQINE
jgi:hypothetical protein